MNIQFIVWLIWWIFLVYLVIKLIYFKQKDRDSKGRFLKGHAVSKETKHKLSIVMTGQVPWNKDKKCPQLSVLHKGHKHSKETKRQLVIVMKGCGKGRKIPEESINRRIISRTGLKYRRRVEDE